MGRNMHTSAQSVEEARFHNEGAFHRKVDDRLEPQENNHHDDEHRDSTKYI